MRVGFVGTGNLGAKLASSLVGDGFDVTVHDRDEAAARPLVDARGDMGSLGRRGGSRGSTR